MKINQGNSAEEIAADLDHLTLAQVYAALTYYQANKAEIEADLAAEQAEYEHLAALHSQKTPEIISAKFVVGIHLDN